MRALKWLVPFLFLFALLGCQEMQYSGGITKPNVIKRQVSLSPGVTEIMILYSHALTVGRTASCDFPGQALKIPVVMTGTKPDMEKLAQVKPDGVIYDPQLISQSDIDKIKALGIQTVPISGDTINDFMTSLWKYGSTSNSESTITEYSEVITKDMANAKANLEKIHKKVVVLMPGVGSEHMIAGTKSLIADVIHQMGSTLIGPDTSIYVNLNAEDLIKDAPDVILVAGDAKPIGLDPRFQGLAAIKKNNVFALNPEVALRRGARLDQLIQDISTALLRSK
jgi:ABC-type Fe3+-hydroxamate transport system substrate-binding protein